MFITASKLYDYLQCPHRVWRDVYGPQEEKMETNSFVKLLWEKGKEVSKEKFTQGFTWALSSIAELIQEGCKTDDWSFNEKLNSQAEEIIEQILEKYKDPDAYAQKDQLTHALNSPLGKTVSALIYLGLHEARLSDKRKENKESKWSEKLRNNFDYTLDKKKLPDAYVLMGEYLANLHYIDKRWVEEKVKKIEKIKDEKLYASFLEGYLYINNVYNALYKLMRSFYKRGLDITFKSFDQDRLKERIVQHIAIGYFRGFEKLKKGLMTKQIIFNHSKRIEEMSGFFWQERNFINGENSNDKKEVKKIRKDFKEKIFKFWKYVVKIYKKKKKLGEDDQKALSELSKLTVYCSQIDKEEFELIKMSAPFVTVGYDSSFFIKSLNLLKDKGKNKLQTAKYTAELFIEMLKGAKESKNFSPDYQWTHIEEIIKYLYDLVKKSKNKEIKKYADDICNFYAESGNFNLRYLYEENNR